MMGSSGFNFLFNTSYMDGWSDSLSSVEENGQVLAPIYAKNLYSYQQNSIKYIEYIAWPILCRV